MLSAAPARPTTGPGWGVESAPHFDAPAARQCHHQTTAGCRGQRRGGAGHFDRNPTVARHCLALYLPLPVAGKRGQADPRLRQNSIRLNPLVSYSTTNCPASARLRRRETVTACVCPSTLPRHHERRYGKRWVGRTLTEEGPLRPVANAHPFSRGKRGAHVVYRNRVFANCAGRKRRPGRDV